jgi:putative membrane protein
MIGFIKFLFVVIIVAIGLAFHVKNDTMVTINYYLGTVDVSLSVVVIASLLIGALLGMITSLGMMVPLRRERSKLKKSVKTAEQEVSNLRSIPLQDAD